MRESKNGSRARPGLDGQAGYRLVKRKIDVGLADTGHPKVSKRTRRARRHVPKKWQARKELDRNAVEPCSRIIEPLISFPVDLLGGLMDVGAKVRNATVDYALHGRTKLSRRPPPYTDALPPLRTPMLMLAVSSLVYHARPCLMFPPSIFNGSGSRYS